MSIAKPDVLYFTSSTMAGKDWQDVKFGLPDGCVPIQNDQSTSANNPWDYGLHRTERSHDI